MNRRKSVMLTKLTSAGAYRGFVYFVYTGLLKNFLTWVAWCIWTSKHNVDSLVDMKIGIVDRYRHIHISINQACPRPAHNLHAYGWLWACAWFKKKLVQIIEFILQCMF